MERVQFNKPIPKGALEICQTLNEEGYESWLVGGCVRDTLLNKTPKDWDITTNATPDIVLSIFPNTFATGLKHGTVTVHKPDGDYEITTYRTEGKYSDSRHPDYVEFVNTIEEDLSRRDLTINAIAYDPISKTFKDPFKGMRDLKSKIIRTVNNPYDRYNEDALRILRTYRFAAQLNFTINSNTLQAAEHLTSNLCNISTERVWSELTKILKYNANYLFRMGKILKLFIPDIYFAHPEYWKVIPTMKPYNEDIAIVFFLKNTDVSENMAKRFLESMHLPNKQIRNVMALFEMLPMFCPNSLESFYFYLIDKKYTLQEMDRFYEAKRVLFENKIANHYEYQGYKYMENMDEYLYSYKMYLEVIKTRPISLKELAINGNDIKKMIPTISGKDIGVSLNKALQYAFFHPEQNNRTDLLNLINFQYNNIEGIDY